VEAEDWAAAAEAATQALAANPYAVAGGSPYVLLAEAHHRLGDRASAIEALITYWQAGGRRTAPLDRLGDWLDEAGRAEESLAVRRALALVDPLPAERRASLGDRLLADGAAEEALTEYLAYESRAPHDQAYVHFRIAKAYRALGDDEQARRRVLLALEVAPQFQEALELLVELSSGR
jgi:tetratricopeptide (TPR) repeat protein